MLDSGEDVEQSVAELSRSVEESIVRGRVPGVIPDPFRGIELR